MKKKVATRYAVIPNPELQHALRGFVPVFGNDDDLYIAKRLESINTLLPQVDNEVLRGKKKGEGKGALTGKMKEILQKEQQLIDTITRRNMDF